MSGTLENKAWHLPNHLLSFNMSNHLPQQRIESTLAPKKKKKKVTKTQIKKESRKRNATSSRQSTSEGEKEINEVGSTDWRMGLTPGRRLAPGPKRRPKLLRRRGGLAGDQARHALGLFTGGHHSNRTTPQLNASCS